MRFWKRKAADRAEAEERARQIFEFQLRGKKYAADPMMVALALTYDAEYKQEHLEKAQSHDPLSLEVCASAAARVFKLDRFTSENQDGATIAELVGLLHAFDLWCYQLQKKT